MPLEAATFISGLVNTNPPSGDLTSQGDDHLRLLKSVMQATFPNANRAYYLNSAVAKTADYTILTSDENKTFLADATATVVDLTLPTVGLFAGFTIAAVKTDAGANAVNLTPNAGTINGVASIVLAIQFSAAICVWTGSTWIAFRYFANSIDGDVTINDDLTVEGESTFNDVVTFNQGIEFNGPLQIDGVATFNSSAIFNDVLQFLSQDLTDGATVNWDMGLQPFAKWTAAGNRTVAAPTGEAAGQWGFLLYTQDAAGNRNPTFNAAYKGPNGVVQRPSMGANAQTLYLYFVRGVDDVLLVRLWASDRYFSQMVTEFDLGNLDTIDGATTVQAHGLGHMPAHISLWLECTTTDQGWAVGDRVMVNTGNPAVSVGSGFSVGANATNLYFACENAQVNLNNRATGASALITNARWKVIIKVSS